MTFPEVFFTVDDFDAVFENVVVDRGQSICVELVATAGEV